MGKDSTRARRAAAAFAGVSLAATFTAVADPPDLCARMKSFAATARDGKTHQVELRVSDRLRPTCATRDGKDRDFCAWLMRYWKSAPYYNGLSRDAIACTGHDPDPPPDADPDAVVVDAMWTQGTWRWESDEFARGRVAFEFRLDISAEANPRTFRFVARPG